MVVIWLNVWIFIFRAHELSEPGLTKNNAYIPEPPLWQAATVLAMKSRACMRGSSPWSSLKFQSNGAKALWLWLSERRILWLASALCKS